MKKKKEPQLNPEEHEKEQLAHQLKRLADHKDYYQKPTRTFEVNEKVIPLTARWDSCVIKDSYENLFYLVSYQSTNTSRGETKTSSHNYWVPWYEIGKSDVTMSSVLFNERQKNINNQFSFSNRELGDLISKKHRFGINENPDYQRGLVWSNEDKELLVDSIFKGIEIRKFVFISLDYKSDNSPLYEILDGKQRLNAIMDFLEDRFSYKGFFYSQLQNEDRQYFSRYLITVGESRGELTDKEKYEYFLRLNTRGKEQSQEHLDYVQSLLTK